jgi:PAS domain S-box-containing protein
MLRFYRKLSLNLKFLLFISAVLLIIFTALAFTVYSSQKAELIRISDNRMYNQLEDLNALMDIEYRYKQESVDRALKIAANSLYRFGLIYETRDKVPFVAINQATNSKRIVEVQRWEIDNQKLQNNTALVDTIQSLTSGEVAFFQKIPDGYMRISTTEKDGEEKRLEGYYFPNNAAVVQTIERGKAFRGRLKLNNEWHIAAFEPLRVSGEISGMLYTGIQEKDIGYLRRKFKEKKYYTTGYPFAMTLDGEFVIHPIFEKRINEDANFLDYAKRNKRGKYRFRYPDNEEGAWKLTYFTYYEPFDLIIGATVDESQILDKPLSNIRNTLLIGFFIALLVCLLGIGLLVNSITAIINKIVGLLENMALGKKIEKINIQLEDEIGYMARSVNTLVEGFDSYTNFAQQIGQGNLKAEFKPLSEEDALGNALLEMRKGLSDIAQEEQRQSWLSSGITLFSDLLRRYNEDVQELAHELIAQLVKYIKANQGGIFVLNEDPVEPQLEMLACYAYDKHKIVKKEIRVGEGLIGQAFKEVDTLNIQEVPEEYIQITSGLGEARPRNILIVPLANDNIVIGAIELASFEPFSPLEIEFVESLSKIITTTIASVRNNLRTKTLLRDSQELTERLRAQEEEMRQNVEELQATQEEMQRNQKEVRRLLAEAKNKEEALDALLNHTSDLIIALDRDYKITLYNEAAKQWYYELNGVKLSVGISILPLLTSQQRENYKEYYDRALLGEDFVIDESIADAKGESSYYEHSFHPIQDAQGKPAGISIFSRNITKRKAQEEGLQNAYSLAKEQEKLLQKNYQQLQDNYEQLEKSREALLSELETLNRSSLARLVLHPDGTIEQANNALLQIFQYNEEELIGQNHKILLTEEESSKADYLNFWRNLRNGIPQPGSYHRINKYKEEVWLNGSYLPIVDSKGKVLHILFLASDETDYKLKERFYLNRIQELSK